MKRLWLSAVALLATIAVPTVASASFIVVSLGNTAPTNSLVAGSPPLVSGTTYGSAIIAANFVAPFFTDFCGNIETLAGASNCDKSWTFNYVIPVGETITAASLTVGLWDLDSRRTGSQVGLYQVNGGDVLTSAINTAAEALNGGTGSANVQYDVFTFSLANFGALSGGSATVHLAFSGPAGPVVGPDTQFNSGAILFSTLNITTQASTNPPNPPNAPEPAALLLMATALGAGFRGRVRRALGRQ